MRAGRLADFLSTANRVLRTTSPFTDHVRAREVIWLEPRVVAEISYAEIVQGRLRAPVFRGVADAVLTRAAR